MPDRRREVAQRPHTERGHPAAVDDSPDPRNQPHWPRFPGGEYAGIAFDRLGDRAHGGPPSTSPPRSGGLQRSAGFGDCRDNHKRGRTATRMWRTGRMLQTFRGRVPGRDRRRPGHLESAHHAVTCGPALPAGKNKMCDGPLGFGLLTDSRRQLYRAVERCTCELGENLLHQPRIRAGSLAAQDLVLEPHRPVRRP